MMLGVIYVTGLVINRLSSVFVEDLLINCRLLGERSCYSDFNNARKQNPFLYVLSREYALSRASFALFFILMFLYFGYFYITMINLWLIIIFLFSMRKHSKKINEVVKDFKETAESRRIIS
jgi:hypothetical protein